MTVLMLRGPQTPGELRARSERIHRFESGDELDSTLEGLMGRNLVTPLPRRPGERGQRYEQLLSAGEDAAAAPVVAPPAPSVAPPAPEPPPSAGLEPRVERLEREVAALSEQLRALRDDLGAS